MSGSNRHTTASSSSTSSSFIDFASDSPLPTASQRQGSIYSFDEEADEDDASLLLSHFPASPGSRGSQRPSTSRLAQSPTQSVALTLNPPVNVSFNKGSQLFKLKYSTVNVRKDGQGYVKFLELSDYPRLSSAFIHKFPNAKMPIPHVEQPYTSGARAPFVVSFLEEQTVQVADTVFSAQPHYAFTNWADCVRFQETQLDQQLLFIAGMSEARSKGRGEECISQNLRVFRARNGKQTIIFFANSQRSTGKRYVSITMDSIGQIDQGKKTSKRVALQLRPNTEILSQLKALQVEFLDLDDKRRFWALLCAGVGVGGS